jgi:hypothetical protein
MQFMIGDDEFTLTSTRSPMETLVLTVTSSGKVINLLTQEVLEQPV